MHDTTPEITLKICEMIQRKSPVERLKMASSMYETSKSLIIRAIRENNPSISNAELKIEFFLRFYGNDFNSVDKMKILSYLKGL